MNYTGVGAWVFLFIIIGSIYPFFIGYFPMFIRTNEIYSDYKSLLGTSCFPHISGAYNWNRPPWHRPVSWETLVYPSIYKHFLVLIRTSRWLTYPSKWSGYQCSDIRSLAVMCCNVQTSENDLTQCTLSFAHTIDCTLVMETNHQLPRELREYDGTSHTDTQNIWTIGNIDTSD